MQVFELGDPSALAERTHPWRGSIADAGHCYYDLRRNPALIRTSLEDLLPWQNEPAIEGFYQLLEWVNGANSRLESSDCAFSGPSTNETEAFAKALQCSGRLMLLFRDALHNTDTRRVHAFTDSVARALSMEDEGFQWGVIGVTIVPVRFVDLPAGQQQGSQLMLSFWAWGDDEAEVMANLGRTLSGVTRALRTV